ncbi:hypothetical protein STPYR_12513 [uncultured Stenotrophomonas sp.]|uniref:Uncharacterized protein n=1 Tax=uncultured Stenotrophomonas sp. TaxID=165438 RepID=A0A1Y5QAZ4_9GAMM|nr:hypothetical protein STPYR_12513 [uncultured Stenotrophomonas sp.]
MGALTTPSRWLPPASAAPSSTTRCRCVPARGSTVAGGPNTSPRRSPPLRPCAAGPAVPRTGTARAMRGSRQTPRCPPWNPNIQLLHRDGVNPRDGPDDSFAACEAWGERIHPAWQAGH